MNGKTALVLILFGAAVIGGAIWAYAQIDQAKQESEALRNWASEMADWSKTTTKSLADDDVFQERLIADLNRRHKKLNESLGILGDRLETLQLATLSEDDQKAKLEDKKEQELDPKLQKHDEKVKQEKEDLDEATDEIKDETGEDSPQSQDAEEFQDEYSDDESPVQSDMENWKNDPGALADPMNRDRAREHAEAMREKRDEIEGEIKDLDSRIAQLKQEIAVLEAKDPKTEEDLEQLNEKRKELARLEKEKQVKEEQFDFLSALMCMLKVVTKIGAVAATLEGNPAAGASLNEVSDSIPCDAGSGKDGEGEFTQPPGGPPAQPPGPPPGPQGQSETNEGKDSNDEENEENTESHGTDATGGGTIQGSTLNVDPSAGPYAFILSNLDVMYLNTDTGGDYKKLLTIIEADREKVENGAIVKFSLDPANLIVRYPADSEDFWLLENGQPATKAPDSDSIPDGME